MTTELTPRPKVTDMAVIAVSVSQHSDDIVEWCKHAGFTPDLTELLPLVSLAIHESDDPYWAGKYLEDFVGLPTDIHLVRIAESIYRNCNKVAMLAVHDWVMKTQTRFPAKDGQGVRVKIGDAEFTAKVVAVIGPDAAAIVEPIGKPGKNIRVNSEEVVKVVSIGSTGTPGPDNFPTGGTPVAARPVREKKVA